MGETKVVGCCERTAACQLVTTNLVLAVCGVVMMIFSTIILLKVTAGFAIAILSVGGFMILLSIYGCWSSKDSADCRIYLYIVLLCMALLAQVVLAVWYLVNPDIMEDAANKGCETKSSDGDYVCDADCKSCQASVQDVKNYVRSHSTAVAVVLCVVLGVEAIAILSACCKQSLAHSRNAEHKSLLAVSYTHLRAHETPEHLVCRLLLEKKKNKCYKIQMRLLFPLKLIYIAVTLT
eukprot:TRINITY_DN2516_c0_g1_i7.p1 TRINITY_DN2516_c0_g1~~TRINITY_DN2516_c0_g1_i7.p1  ORF type:complete len:236 (-),score=47.91 TRINITY_DN2516_c0_g1_i7:3-710(-)